MKHKSTFKHCSTVKDTEQFVEKYFTLVCDSEAFLELPISNLVELLERNGLYVENEETVCKAALRWVDHDPKHRKMYISRILKCVRLLTLKPAFLAKVVGRHPIVRNDRRSRDLLDEVKDYHLIPVEDRSLPYPSSSEPRSCPNLPCFFFAIGGASSESAALCEVEKYDPVRRQWVAAEPMPTRRKKFGIAEHNGMVCQTPTSFFLSLCPPKIRFFS
ncbi:unnamed protein product [Strongylus vulgaris]|uniref:BACK domain-containing protein n=1 Tax=Strongylus vulgaris TaxID=40348 RepID=A0A3P7IRV7_STRVU|nr:unnamed protein product [Strongylus vulgaris]